MNLRDVCRRSPLGLSIVVAASRFRSALLGLTFALGVATPCSAQTLTVSAPNPSITIHPGDTNIPLAVTLTSNASSGPVTITLTGLPSGISVTPITLSGGGTGTLQLSASISADQEAFSSTQGPAFPNIATTAITLLAFTSSTQATASVALTVSLTNPAFIPSPSNINLPIVNINTNGAPIVDKTTDIPGTITITSANGQTSYLPNSTDTDNTAIFHVHGNSTAQMPKLPYHVSLNTSVDLLEAMGLVCPYVTSSGKSTCDKSGTYILLANYDDKTLLRDWSASALANAIPRGGAYLSYPPGSPTPTGTSALGWWAPHSLFVELYLNGQYEGNYQLIEEVKVDTHRINVTKMTDTDISGNSLTGGYLVEIDQRQTEDFVWVTPQGVYMGLDAPDFTPEVPEQTSYIQTYVDTAETALFSSSYTDPVLGWRSYFDQTSAINFYIVNDLMGNVDGGDFYSSTYFYKGVNNPLLYMGPIWDFDISSGNVNYYPIASPTVPWMQTQNPWYPQWFSDPGFSAAVVQQWNALKNGGVFSAWLASISQEAGTLQQSQINNFGRWPMQGIEVWPNPQAAGSYNAEVGYLTNWLSTRMAYLDSLFNNKVATTISLTVPTTTFQTGVSATLTAQVAGGTSPSGVVTFTSNGIVIGAGTLNGSETATLSVSNLPTGSDTLQATYDGDNVNGLAISVPVTITVLGPVVETSTNLSASATSITYLGPVTLTATVVGTSGTSTPTGSFTFVANGSVLGTAAVSAVGTASYTTSALQVGNDVVQATYGGDTNYAASTSNSDAITVLAPAAAPVFSLASGTYNTALSLTLSDTTPGSSIFYTTDGSTPTMNSTHYSGPINIGYSETVEAIAAASGYANSPVSSAAYVIPPSFSIAVSPSSTGSSMSQPASFVVTITPEFNFSSVVALTCSGLPTGDTCSFSPSSVTASGAPITSVMTISPWAIAGLRRPQLLNWRGGVGGVVLALAVWPFRRRRRLNVFLGLFAMLVIGLSIGGCSGGIQKETVSISVSAQGGGVSQTAVLTATVPD